MTSRGRGGSMSDWDPMRDDFNDTSYNTQYPDEDASEAVQLDHSKLYITKLPTALSQDGFVDLFSKYGRVVHSYFSRDPQKRYAFVTFETAGEARIAMMKLNKTDPFYMNICFGHNKNPTRTQQSQPNMDRSQSNTDRQINRHHSTTDRHNHSIREDSASVSSRGRKSRNIEENINGNEDDDEIEDSDVGHDPELGYNLEKLKFKRLQIIDEQLQVQQRMLIHQQRMKSNAQPTTRRRLLPDGRSIQISQDKETSITAGGGDSRNIPGLQRESSRRCVACGAPADLYCAGCRLTPYCAERCQRRDWDARHRSVCHNLLRSSTDEAVYIESNGTDVPVVAPLRRPHSPSKNSPREPQRNDRAGMNFIPPAEVHAAHQQAQQRKGNPVMSSARNLRNQERSDPTRAENQPNQGGREEITQIKNQASSRRFTPTQRRPPLRQPVKPTPEPKPAPVEPKPAQAEPKPEPATPNNARPGSLGDATPRKPLVPANYVLEKLSVGEKFLAEVLSPAEECGSSQAGCVCLTLHEQYGDQYAQLCEDFKEECQKDPEEHTPRIGETFAYYCEDDEFWYRARCLSLARAALLDAGRVVSFAPAACRRLPPAYAAIPEFIALLNTTELSIGVNLSCKVVSASSSGLRVSVEDGSGQTVQVEATRWIPDVEYPKEAQRPPLRQTQLKQSTPEPQAKPTQTVLSPREVSTPKIIKEPVLKEPTPVPKSVSSRLVQNVEAKPLIPAKYLLEKLSVGEKFLAEVLSPAEECGSSQAGCVCLTLHEQYGDQYSQLCEDFKGECQKDTEEYTPRIGETFAYYCEDDEFWYRARCLSLARAALLDAGRVVSFAPAACRRLPPAYAAIPEFIALLNTTELSIGVNLSCEVVSASSSGLRVSVEDGSGQTVQVQATRWIPDVEYPKEVPAPAVSKPAAVPSKPASAVAGSGAIVPEVLRPQVSHNALYLLLDVTSLRRACVRPCEPRLAAMFDAVLQDTVQYGLHATPLTQPPQKGQTVVAKFIEDNTHYRAFVKRVNVAMNKYMIEYIEYGNEEIVPLERLYPCPPKLQLDVKPAQASFVKLSEREPATLSRAASKYIDSLKENLVQLILTIPGGIKTASSGSLVNLIIAKNCEPASKRIEELCTPEWKKLLERGGDVLEVESRNYKQLEYASVPTSRPFTLRITFCDTATLTGGAVNGYEKGYKAADFVYGELTRQINEYCDSPLCREPYLPKIEELCIARSKRLNKWVRSVLVDMPEGPGSRAARVLHIDYGDLVLVPVSDLRKMMPEFVDEYPALAQHFDIKDFPQVELTPDQIERAMKLMRVTSEGTGELQVSRCRELEDKMLEVEAPDLINALIE